MTITLTGTNMFALNQRLSELKDGFSIDYGVSGIEEFSGEDLEEQDLGSLLQGATLFDSNRLIILRNVSANKLVADKLPSMLKSIPSETRLVLVESALDKRTAFYKALKNYTDFKEFAELDEYAAVKWVSETVQKEGGTVSQSDARLLVSYAGTDQFRLANEITKLVAYNRLVSEQTITELVEKNPQDTIFQLLERALGGDTKQALNILDNLERAHEDPFQVANMLIWQTHILAVVVSASAKADSEIAMDMKINPFVVKKTKSLARNLSKQKLQQIIDAVADLDVTLKTSGSDPWRVLEQTLLIIQ